MGTHPIFESDFDCLTEMKLWVKKSTQQEKLDRGQEGMASSAL